MSRESSPEFSGLRAFFWPIHRHELKKAVPMLIIFFLICFNYNILRGFKDSLLITAPSSGAEALPFIKVWLVVPMALIMTALLSALSNRFSKENVFYVMMTIFLCFFFLFAFILYPNRETLHPNTLADRMQTILPVGLQGLIAIFRNWTYSAYYIMAEMWSTIIMTVLFWGFANAVTKVKEAKRFYALLCISANSSAIFSGAATSYASKFSLPWCSDSLGSTIIILNLILIVSGAATMLLFRHLNKQGSGYKRTSDGKGERTQVKMGLRQNFAYLMKSRYLLYIAIIVIMYNVCINLVEVVWKDQLHELYPNPNDYTNYMGHVMTATGTLATLISAFVSGNIIRRCSWTTSALITPFIMLITGIGFFGFALCHRFGIDILTGLLGVTPLFLCVFFGSLQNCLARASKYTLFDTTKEMSFIPLSEESKLKGKAAIDGVGSRLGKSGGSIIHQGLLLSLGTVAYSIPYVGAILMVVILFWVLAVRNLGKQFNDLTEHHEKLNIQDEDSSPLPAT